MAATILALLVFLCLACSRSHTYSTRDGSVTVSEPDKEHSSVKITGKDGESTVEIGSGQVVKDYPADVPLYQGKSLMDVKAGAKHARSLSVETPDPADKIAAFYKSELDSKGWKTDSSVSTAGMTMYTATKGDRQLVIQIMSEGDKRTIMQQLADKD